MDIGIKPLTECLAGWNKDVFTIDCAPILVQNAITIMTGIVGLAAVILILLAGVRYITSGGDKEKVANAQKTLTFAIIGLIVVVFSFAIIGIIGQLTGVKSNQLFEFKTEPPLTDQMCKAKHPTNPFAQQGQCCLTPFFEKCIPY